MPSLKLSNPFRRGADRPSLKQRAANLKATASRVIRKEAPLSADAELIALGLRFDEERAAWLAMVPASRDAIRRVRAFEASIKRKVGETTTFDYCAAWQQPGVMEAHTGEEEAHGRLCEVVEAIRALPAHTSEGLAIKARALVATLWPAGDYEEGAALGLDEDWDKAGARDLIEACCRLAGVDWQGKAR